MQHPDGYVDARIGGIHFQGRPGDLDNAYVLDTITGWDDGPQIRRNEVARPTARGSFDAEGYASARVIAISGTIIAQSPTMLRKLARKLTALLVDGSKAPLEVQNDDGVTWAMVRLAGQTTVVVNGRAPTVAAYKIQFWAPDPLRFGTERTAGPATSLQLSQRGEVGALARFGVRGAMGGYSIVSPFGTYTVTASKSASDLDEIDMADGWLFRNGVLQAGAVSRAETWEIPPWGEWTHTLVPTSGSGTLSAAVNDTFM